MDVVLVYKWGRDPEEAFVYDDGTFKYRRDRLVASDDDAAAAACARKLAEATEGHITGVTIGSGDVSWAMARGAARGVSAESLMPSVDDAQTARSLARAIQAAGNADVVVVGNALDAAGVAGVLAAELDLPLVADVQEFEADKEHPGCIIARRKNGKTLQTLRITTPALIAIAATESEKTVPTMKQMLAAKKAPVEKIDATSDESGHVSTVSYRRPEVRRARMFDGTAEEAAQALVNELRAIEAL